MLIQISKWPKVIPTSAKIDLNKHRSEGLFGRHTLLTGELIDNRYLLKHRLASGGMATIYSGIDTRLDRPVAVKIMHSHLANDEAFVSRFIKEAKATAALSHPNIVSIQDQGWNEGGPPAVFLVMELVEGSTLRDYLNEQGALPIEQVFQLITPVLSALAAAHKIGIIHRDIKPENILISKDGRVKVADFGLARNVKEPSVPSSILANLKTSALGFPTTSPCKIPAI